MNQQDSHSGRRICLAAYNDRLASLFDTAVSLDMYSCRDGSHELTGRIMLSGNDPLIRLRGLLACEVDVLICGGISRAMLDLLSQTDIEVYPWIRGSLTQVIEGWRTGSLDRLTMPGCHVETGHTKKNEETDSSKPSDFHLEKGHCL